MHIFDMDKMDNSKQCSPSPRDPDVRSFEEFEFPNSKKVADDASCHSYFSLEQVSSLSGTDFLSDTLSNCSSRIGSSRGSNRTGSGSIQFFRSSDFLPVTMANPTSSSSSTRTGSGKSEYHPSSQTSPKPASCTARKSPTHKVMADKKLGSVETRQKVGSVAHTKVDYEDDFEANEEVDVQNGRQELSLKSKKSKVFTTKQQQKNKLNVLRSVKPNCAKTMSPTVNITVQPKVGNTEKAMSKQFIPNKQGEAEKVRRTKVRLDRSTAPEHCKLDIKTIRSTTTAIPNISNVQSRAGLNKEPVKSPKGVVLPSIVTGQRYVSHGDRSVPKQGNCLTKLKAQKLTRHPSMINEHTLPKLCGPSIRQQAKTKPNSGGLGVTTQNHGNHRMNEKGNLKHQSIKLPPLCSQNKLDNGHAYNSDVIEERAQKPPFDTKIDNKEARRRFFHQ